MRRNNLLFLGILLVVFLSLMGSVLAVGIYTSSYSTNKSHMGASGSVFSTTAYTARDTVTYQQAGTRLVETSTYSANSGWFVVESEMGIVNITEVFFSNDSVFNYSNVFNKSEITYDMNLTYLGANCSAMQGEVYDVTFSLYNEEDGTVYLNETSYTFKDGYSYVLNASYVVRDSGNWTLNVSCYASDNGVTKVDESLWEIAWGSIVINLINPFVDSSVELYEFFTFDANVTCSVDGECGVVNVTLDPELSEEEEEAGCYLVLKEDCLECEAGCQSSCPENSSEECIECEVGCEDDCYEVECLEEEGNETVEENATLLEVNVTLPEENVTVLEENVTVLENETSSGGSEVVANETLNNETITPETNLSEIVGPKIVEISIGDLNASISLDKYVEVLRRELIMPEVSEDAGISVMSVEEKKFEYITPILAVELMNESGATVVLPKNLDSDLEVIVKCDDWSFNDSECDGEWYVYATTDELEQDLDSVTFEVDSFSAYAGGNLTDGETAFLVIWDENDVGMDGAVADTASVRIVNENVTFFADYKIAKNATKISDGECTVLLNGSVMNMTYDGSSYYNHTMNMTVAGSYDYTVSCIHDTYTDLSVDDSVIVGEYTDGTKGAVSTVVGATPFYTTSSNPQECDLRGGETCNVTWEVNSTGILDKIYDFFVEAIGNYIGYTNSSHLDLQITGNDSTSPVFVYGVATPSVITNASSVTLNANVYDNVQVDSVWVNVTLPDDTSVMSYSLPYSFTNTALIGDYVVTFYANDTSGNNATYSTSFESAEGFEFNFTLNITGEVHIVFTDPDSDEVIHENVTNVSYSVELPNILYTAFFAFESNDTFNVTFDDFNLSLNDGEVFGGDEHNELADYLVTYGVETEYNFTSATLILGYEDLSYSVESNLRLWKCEDYNFSGRSCDGSWIQITDLATQNMVGDYFEYDATGFSGFSIDEYIAPDEDEEETTSGGGGGWGACNIGYEFVNGACILIVFEKYVTEDVVDEDIPELPEELFDIRMDLEKTFIENANELEAVITFASFGTVPTPVDLTYVILDEAGNEVYREGGEIVVTTEEVLRKRFEYLDLPSGKYTFVFSSLYDVDVYDEYTSEFTVGRRTTITGNVIGWVRGSGKWWLIGFAGLILLVGLVWWLIGGRRRERSKKIKKRSKKKERRLKAYAPKRRGKSLGIHFPNIKVKGKKRKFRIRSRTRDSFRREISKAKKLGEL